MESSLRPRDPNELNLHGEFANRRASPKKRRRREYRRKHSSVGRTHRRNPSSPQVEEHSSVSHRSKHSSVGRIVWVGEQIALPRQKRGEAKPINRS